MPLDLFNGPLYLTFALGAGLLVGGLGLAVRRWDRRGQVGVAVTSAAVAVGAAAVFDPAVAVVAGGLAAVPIGLLLLAGTRLWAAAAAQLRRPAVAGALTATAGVALIVGGQTWYDVVVQKTQDAELAQLMLSEYQAGSMSDPVGVTAATDRGNPIRLGVPTDQRPAAEVVDVEKYVLKNPEYGLRLIRRQPAGRESNCHGWVFTGGRFWIASESIDAILAENGYAAVAAPGAGDVVIYRKEDGKVSHTALVRAVVDDGTVLVEGKWGLLGVYLHEVSASNYGQLFTFYRSPRPGHLLRGLDPVAAVGSDQFPGARK